jgi:two-component system cell cycle response regulator DivK
MVKPTSQPLENKRPPRNNGKSAGRRILVVEDHDDTRAMIRALLEMENFVVLEAVDGKAAVDTTLQHRPDLILMDLTLPTLDGVTATRLIRRDQTVGRTPIIFLSGRAEPGRRQDALDAGCDDYLVKPVEIEDVLAVMERWLTPAARNAAQGSA